MREVGILAANLVEEFPANRSHTTYEEVKNLILREEERVVEDVESLSQRFSVDDERYICLTGTLRTGNDTDTAAAQGSEEFSGYSGSMLHILAHDSDGGQSALGMHGEHPSIFNLGFEFLVEHGDGSLGIGIADTDGGRILR